MNYIKQILAFQDLVEIKGLSAGQIALWHALINVNNKCGWIEWFSVASSKLQIGTGLSESGIRKARDALKQLGIIDFQFQGTHATKYHLTDLTQFEDLARNDQQSTGDSTGVSAHIVTESARVESGTPNSAGVSAVVGTEDSTGVGAHMVTESARVESGTPNSTGVSTGVSAGVGAGVSAALYKQNKTKRNSNINIITPPAKNDDAVALENLSQFYQENIGPLSPVMYENLQDSLQDFTEQGTKSAEAEEIIKLAISKSVENNKRSWGYIHAILKDWLDHRIYTLASVKTYQRDWRHKKDRPKGQTGYDFNENDPDYDPKRLEGLF